MVQMLEPLTLTLGTLIHARAVEEERARAERQLDQQATADALTGLANRRRFFDVSMGLLAQCRRYGPPATVALMDLDHFKQVNDRHGHAMGDAVLKAFSGVLLEVLRESDLAARVGGEEFAVLLPSTTAEEAQIPLERIRQLLSARVVELEGQQVSVSVSIGVCEWREELDSPDASLAQADQALYAAKDGGRNRLCVAPPGVVSRRADSGARPGAGCRAGRRAQRWNCRATNAHTMREASGPLPSLKG